MNITKNTVVQIHYTLTNDDGNVLDSSKGKEPLEYIHGKGMIVKGLENALEGKSAGEAFLVKVIPSEGYGEINKDMISVVPRSVFQADTIEVGMMFYAETPAGALPIRIAKIDGDNVTIDANHELAGQNLNFDIEVVAVREATEDELKPHHHCCCHDHGEEEHHCENHAKKENCDGKGGCGCKHHDEHHH